MYFNKIVGPTNFKNRLGTWPIFYSESLAYLIFNNTLFLIDLNIYEIKHWTIPLSSKFTEFNLKNTRPTYKLDLRLIKS